jgi:hypothetical protein
MLYGIRTNNVCAQTARNHGQQSGLANVVTLNLAFPIDFSPHVLVIGILFNIRPGFQSAMAACWACWAPNLLSLLAEDE